MAGGALIIPNANPVYESPGVPAANATLQIYLTGTTTSAEIFADINLTTPISNPLISDTNGLFYAQSTQIFANSAVAYDAVLTCPNGQSWSYETLWGLGQGPNISGYLQNPNVVLTGAPQAPTPAVNDSSAAIATTAFVTSLLGNYAPIASPSLSGIPTVPTANAGASSTQIASTAFVSNAITTALGTIQGASYANLSIAATILTINQNVGFASITRTGTGTISFIFSTARTNTNYCVFFGIQNSTQLQCVLIPSTKATTGFTAQVLEQNNDPSDANGLSVQVVG